MADQSPPYHERHPSFGKSLPYTPKSQEQVTRFLSSYSTHVHPPPPPPRKALKNWMLTLTTVTGLSLLSFSLMHGEGEIAS